MKIKLGTLTTSNFLVNEFCRKTELAIKDEQNISAILIDNEDKSINTLPDFVASVKFSRHVKPYEQHVLPLKAHKELTPKGNNIPSINNQPNKELGFTTLPKHLLEKLNESALIFSNTETRNFNFLIDYKKHNFKPKKSLLKILLQIKDIKIRADRDLII